MNSLAQQSAIDLDEVATTGAGTAAEAESYVRTSREGAPRAQTDETKMLMKWIGVFWLVTILGVVALYVMIIYVTMP